MRTMSIVLVLAVAIAFLPLVQAANAAALVLEVKSSLAGIVLAEDLVKVGATVQKGQPLVYVQTEKKPRAVAATAPLDGVVYGILVKPGQRIEQGDVIVHLTPPPPR